VDLKSFASAISQLSQEKGLAPEKIIEGIETALAAAYKKEYGEKSQTIKAKLDVKTGEADFWQIKTVVDESMIFSEEELEAMKEKTALPEALPEKDGKVLDGGKPEAEETAKEKSGEEHLAKEGKDEATVSAQGSGLPAKALAKEGELIAASAEGYGEPMEKVRFNPEKHIMIEDAKEQNPEIEVGDEVKIPLEKKQDFGRIAAQTAKQVIIQKIREAEKEMIFSDFKLKEGEIISAVVQRLENRAAYMDIGKTTGILNREEQVPGEFYRPGQRLKAFVLKVEQTSKGPVIFLSRAYPKLVSKLFELEVPEIADGQVVIKSIAREAGSRTKVALASAAEGVDAIGAAVGQRGTRVSAVINELGGEKIDIVEYSEDTQKYIINALSPAKIIDVKILPKNRAMAVVPDDQLSLAIGKDGQNVRLAAKLTGWKIDVRSPEAFEEIMADMEKEEQKADEAGKDSGEKPESEAAGAGQAAEEKNTQESGEETKKADGKEKNRKIKKDKEAHPFAKEAKSAKKGAKAAKTKEKTKEKAAKKAKKDKSAE